MTSIYRTAYPRFLKKRKVSSKELENYYSLNEEELKFIQKNIRGDNLRLGFGIQLKVFQNMGYFPDFSDIPFEIVNYIRKQLLFISENAEFCYDHDSTIRRHRDVIYEYLNITAWKKQSIKDSHKNSARYHAIRVAHTAAQTMNNHADIINIVMESLRNNKYELPSFNELNQVVKHVRNIVNQKIFFEIDQQLTLEEREAIDQLLTIRQTDNRSGFNDLKKQPKGPTITHLRELIIHHNWLMTFGNITKYLKNISKTKIKQFAEQAKSLDSGDLKKYSSQKSNSLIICLIHQSQSRAKDSLATTFCKTLAKMHKKSDEKFNLIKEELKEKNKNVVLKFMDILADFRDKPYDPELMEGLIRKIGDRQGACLLMDNCTEVLTCFESQSIHLLTDFYGNKRSPLFRLLDSLDPQSTTQDDLLIKAMKFIQEHENCRKEYLPPNIDLAFANKSWQKLIIKKTNNQNVFDRRYLELCVFSCLTENLNSGDVFVNGADAFSDYRQSLLTLNTCEEQMDSYCKSVGLPSNAQDFVVFTRTNLINTADRINLLYPDIKELIIDEKGKLTLKKREPKRPSKSAIWLAEDIKRRMPERNILDILCNAHHYTGWANVFGPISGLHSKIKDPIERYILTTFAYGSAMGPEQTIQHVRTDSEISAHMLSWINRRHITPQMIDKARDLLINFSLNFPILTAWGDGKSCGADGTLCQLREENLIAGFHIRYQQKGCIAYHHIANNYILLFSTFIPCGVWEAVAIIEGLLKNESELQPNTIHADTQGQSTIVFALAYLLGFKLMPRIRNWKDYNFYRPVKTAKYSNIDTLFSETINWNLIETHWQDMMQVVLSIKAGKISSSLLLRKLGSYSRKNKLYYAFQELGRAVRTQFLLEYIADVELREIITATTNKVESYNRLSQWVSFGSQTLVASNDEDEIEKAIKYNDILTGSTILQTIIDISEIAQQLHSEGYPVTKEDVSFLSPYLTSHIKRFGDYFINLNSHPKDPFPNQRPFIW